MSDTDPTGPLEAPRRPRDRRARPAGIGVLAGLASRAAFDKRGFASASILGRWPDIVGAELAQHAMPVEVRFARVGAERAVLVLQVASGAAATLLQMRAPLLIERVNAFLGYPAIGRIEAHQGPLPKPRRRVRRPLAPASPEAERAVNQKIGDIGSDDVKSALRRLGLSIARRRAAEAGT